MSLEKPDVAAAPGLGQVVVKVAVDDESKNEKKQETVGTVETKEVTVPSVVEEKKNNASKEIKSSEPGCLDGIKKQIKALGNAECTQRTCTSKVLILAGVGTVLGLVGGLMSLAVTNGSGPNSDDSQIGLGDVFLRVGLGVFTGGGGGSLLAWAMNGCREYVFNPIAEKCHSLSLWCCASSSSTNDNNAATAGTTLNTMTEAQLARYVRQLMS
jgi:hypothetical protein